MKAQRLKRIKKKQYSAYRDKQKITVKKHFDKLSRLLLNPLDFYHTTSAINSSQIEGNPIDVNSYYRHKELNHLKATKDIKEIEDLKRAYQYAQKHTLTLDHMLTAHKKATATIIKKSYQGVIRDSKEVYLVNSRREVVYSGCPAIKTPSEVQQLFSDIAIILDREQSIDEVFYFASYIHLLFVNMHPFADGNGRIARLLEKWYLAHHLGTDAWKVQSEWLYNHRRDSYYKNLGMLGSHYDTLDYDNAIPFLCMLPMSLKMPTTAF